MAIKPAKLPRFSGMQPNEKATNDRGLIAPPGKANTQGANPLTPETLLRMLIPQPQGTVTDDSGTITGINPGNPFANVLKGQPEQGTVRNFLQRMLSPTPMAQPNSLDDILNGAFVAGTGKPSTNNTSPTPEKNNKQPSLAPIPVPRNETDTAQPGAGTADLAPPISRDTSNNYSMPTGIDPNMYDQLRESILRDSGQFDPNNANGLAGRMDGPYSKLDQRQGMEAADAISRMFRFRP